MLALAPLTPLVPADSLQCAPRQLQDRGHLARQWPITSRSNWRVVRWLRRTWPSCLSSSCAEEISVDSADAWQRPAIGQARRGAQERTLRACAPPAVPSLSCACQAVVGIRWRRFAVPLVSLSRDLSVLCPGGLGRHNRELCRANSGPELALDDQCLFA